jgi:DNA damage-inducible protein 1
MISVIFSNVQLNFPDSGLLTLDVGPDLTLQDLRALIESETGAPAQIQTLEREGQALQDANQTLRQLGINHNDILGLRVTRPQQPQQSGQTRASNPAARQASEQLRQQLLSNPTMQGQVRQVAPELVEAIADPARFERLFTERERRVREEQRRAQEEIDRLDNDINNPDSQAEILRRIRQQVIAKNQEEAFEQNPESFGTVTMLYIDVLINGVPIKAFVDSGAQKTIMSPSAAEKCGVSHLIDEKWGGIARGVGTAKILGRVHHAIMQFGDYEAPASFMVMEGKDVELLLGLDMLKRHQMCIDLQENCLKVLGTKIEFLPEHQLPKMMDNILENEPKVAGPGGSTIGTETGTILPPGHSANTSSKSPGTTSGSAQQAAPLSSQTQAQAQPQGPPQRSSGITEENINTVMQHGSCDRAQAIALLEAAGGNPELALGLLFN